MQARRKLPDRTPQALARSMNPSLPEHGGRENRMQTYAMTFAGCAICSLIFVYDTTPNVLRVGKIAVYVFTALFVITEIVALVS